MSDSDILKRILIFDDDTDQRKLLIAYLGKLLQGVELEQYDPIAQGVPPQNFDWSRYDVLILDYYLCIHGVTGLDILHQNRKNASFPATIMLTGAGNEEVAMRALKAGVYDYLRKQNLDKQELKNSILLAFEKHKQTRKRMNEVTQQGTAFSKSLFYKHLEYRHDAPEFRRRVLLVLELDNHTAIEESAGTILRDNIVRHMARQAYEVFKLGECNPLVTRLGDHTIALLIDAPESNSTLEFNLKGLLQHLEKRPYKFGDSKYPFTISIGAVRLTGQGDTADSVINQARNASREATTPGASSYRIYGPEAPAAVAAPAPVAKPEPAAVKPAPTPVPTPAPAPAKPAAVAPAAPAKPAPAASKPTPTATAKPAPAATPAPAKPAPAAPSAPVRPQKTLEELKAEAARPKVVAPEKPATPAPTPAPAPAPAEIDPDLSGLDEAGRQLKTAFDEKRVVQLFQPVITLLNEEIESDEEMHKVSLQLVDKDGQLKTAADIHAMVTQPAFKKYVDRWILREIIGRLTSSNSRGLTTFIIDISDASLADAGFFNWLRKMLTGLDAKTPGRFIALEIDAKHLVNLEKQASALITFLRKTHEFKFVLGNVDSADEIIRLAGKIQFDMIRCSHTLIAELAGRTPAEADKTRGNSQLDLIKLNKCRFIADDINDATTLTETIALGAEYATGDFIGEPATQLDDVTNIETFEII